MGESGTMTTIIMRTTEGDIKIDLFDDKTPETVANFLGSEFCIFLHAFSGLSPT